MTRYAKRLHADTNTKSASLAEIVVVVFFFFMSCFQLNTFKTKNMLQTSYIINHNCTISHVTLKQSRAENELINILLYQFVK